MTTVLHRDQAAKVRRRSPLRLKVVLAFACFLMGFGAALAAGVTIPNFWDPRAGQERPELSGTRTIRFLTDDEFPPLHFAGVDGSLTGFSVELARAVCERLAVICTV